MGSSSSSLNKSPLRTTISMVTPESPTKDNSAPIMTVKPEKNDGVSIISKSLRSSPSAKNFGIFNLSSNQKRSSSLCWFFFFQLFLVCKYLKWLVHDDIRSELGMWGFSDFIYFKNNLVHLIQSSESPRKSTTSIPAVSPANNNHQTPVKSRWSFSSSKKSFGIYSK